MISQQVYQLRRAIERAGRTLTVTRPLKNEFKEPGKDSEIVVCGRGLFHTSAKFLDISYSVAGQAFTRKHPQVLMLYTDKIHKHDVVNIDSVGVFEVTGIENLGGLNLCIDLSLEAVLK